MQEHAVTLESAVTGVSLNSRDPSKGIVSFALGLPVQVDLQSGAVTQLPAVPGALTTVQHTLLALLPLMSAALHLLADCSISKAACCHWGLHAPAVANHAVISVCAGCRARGAQGGSRARTPPADGPGHA